MRRKSTRNASKSTPDKAPKEIESPQKTRRSRRRKRSPSKSSESEEEVLTVTKRLPPEETPDTTTKSHTPTDEEASEEPVWKVTPQEGSPKGEIQKLKICLTRPSPDSGEKKSRRSKSNSQTEDDAASSEERPTRRTRSQGSPLVRSDGLSSQEADEELEEKKGKGKSKGKHKSKIEKSPHLSERQLETNNEISENVQVTPQSPSIDKPVDNENDHKVDVDDKQNVNESIQGHESTEESANSVGQNTDNEQLKSSEQITQENLQNESDDDEPLSAIQKTVTETKVTEDSEQQIVTTVSQDVQTQKENEQNVESEKENLIQLEENKVQEDVIPEPDKEKEEIKVCLSPKDSAINQVDEQPVEENVPEQSSTPEEFSEIATPDTSEKIEPDEPMKTASDEQITSVCDEPMTSTSDEPMTSTSDEPMTSASDEPVTSVYDETMIVAANNQITITPDTPTSSAHDEPVKTSSEPKMQKEKLCAESAVEDVEMEPLEGSENVNEMGSSEEKLTASSTEESQQTQKERSHRFKLNRNIEYSFNSENKEKNQLDEPLPLRPSKIKRKWTGGSSQTSVLKLDLESIQNVWPTINFPEEPDLKVEVEKERRKSLTDSSGKKLERKVSVEYKSDSERPSFEKQTSVNSVNNDSEDSSNIIAFNRKISIVDDTASKLKPPPSPAKNPISNILYITNLVRPFTVKQLRELLERTGKIVEDGFWTDRIKSKCYVQYETQEQAEATRNALHGVQWPIGNGKLLIIDYATGDDMQNAKNPPAPPPVATVPEIKIAAKENLEPTENKSRPDDDVKEVEKKRPEGPVREWDIGKKDVRRDRSRSRERGRKHRRSPSPPDDFISRKQRKAEESVPQKLMDDLFLKTKTTPSIYWQPLSPEEIQMKQQQRLIRMEEHKRRMEESSRLKGRDMGRGAFRRRYD